MQFITRPSEAVYSARKLGITYDQTRTHADYVQMLSESPLHLLGGVLPLPPIEACFSPAPDENRMAAAVKASSMQNLAKLLRRMFKADDDQRRAHDDKRFSDQGRLDAKMVAYKVFRAECEAFAEDLDGTFVALLTEFETACGPVMLDAGNAAQAVLDSEYRGIVRGMDGEADRQIYLLSNPGDAIVQAVLRADHQASGISADLHGKLAMKYAIDRVPAAAASVWTAACAMDAASWLGVYGLQRIGAACGQFDQFKPNAVELAMDASEARTRLAQKLESLVKAADLVSTPPPAPLPDSVWALVEEGQ
jgi:hypothetical protein